MKKCLNRKAQRKVDEVLEFIKMALIVVIGVMFVVGMLGNLGVNPRKDSMDEILYVVGTLGWYSVIPVGLFFLGKWYMDNLEDCPEDK